MLCGARKKNYAHSLRDSASAASQRFDSFDSPRRRTGNKTLSRNDSKPQNRSSQYREKGLSISRKGAMHKLVGLVAYLYSAVCLCGTDCLGYSGRGMIYRARGTIRNNNVVRHYYHPLGSVALSPTPPPTSAKRITPMKPIHKRRNLRLYTSGGFDQNDQTPATNTSSPSPFAAFTVMEDRENNTWTRRMMVWACNLHVKLLNASISWRYDILLRKENTGILVWRRWTPLYLGLTQILIGAVVLGTLSAVLPGHQHLFSWSLLGKAVIDFSYGLWYPFKVFFKLLGLATDNRFIIVLLSGWAILSWGAWGLPNNDEKESPIEDEPKQSASNGTATSSWVPTFLAVADVMRTFGALSMTLLEMALLLIKIPLSWSLSTIYWIRSKLLHRRFRNKIPASMYQMFEFDLISQYIDWKQRLCDFGLKYYLPEYAVTTRDVPLANAVLSVPLLEEFQYRFLLDKLWLGVGVCLGGTITTTSHHRSVWVLFNSILFGLMHIGNYFPLTEERRAAYELEWQEEHCSPYRKIGMEPPPTTQNISFNYEREMQRRAIRHFVDTVVYSLVFFNPMYLRRGFFAAVGSHAAVNAGFAKLCAVVEGIPRNLVFLRNKDVRLAIKKEIQRIIDESEKKRNR